MSANQCKGHLYDDTPCPRPVVDGTEWCIFHHPDKLGELVDRFQEEFDEEKRLQKEKHPDYYDFSEFVFPMSVEFSEDLETVYFDKAVFCDYISFWNEKEDREIIFRETAGFNEATFQGDAEFYRTIFKGYAGFYRTIFKGYAGFTGATFQGNARFIEAAFQGGAGFDGANFLGDAWFFEAVFQGGAGFNGTSFQRGTGFFEAVFQGGAGFNGANFQGSAWFNEATFQGNTWFENISPYRRFFLNNISIKSRFKISVREWSNTNIGNQMDEKGKTLRLVIIRDPFIKENGKLVIKGGLGEYTSELIAGYSLLDTKLDKTEFITETWPLGKKRKIIADEQLLYEGENITEELRPTADQVAQVYRRLRGNYEEAKRYSEAGDFYIGEMEMLRKYSKSVPNRILYNLYKIVSNYSESIALPVIWGFLFIIGNALLRCILFNKPPTDEFFPVYLKFLSLTVKAFFPFNRIYLIRDILTRLIGTVIMGTLFLAVRRRLERR